MSTEAAHIPTTEQESKSKQQRRRRKPPKRTPEPGTDTSANPDAGPSTQNGSHRTRAPKPQKSHQFRASDNRNVTIGVTVGQTAGSGVSTSSQQTPGIGGDLSAKTRKPPRPPHPRAQDRRSDASAPPDGVNITSAAGDAPSFVPGKKTPKSKRVAKFNPNLTQPQDAGRPASKDRSEKSQRRGRQTAPVGDDLTSRLVYSLSSPPYADCPICFSAIHPAQPSWSCSPSIPISPVSDDDKDHPATETAQCCWTTFHLKCIRSWASKSVKDVEEAWRARGEFRKGEWRCPGCQAKRFAVPTSYWCFCGSTPDPKPPRLATPHSCGGPCTRTRACGHPCSLTCHPGPCPPCQITIQLPCYCSKQIMSFRCSHLAPSKAKQGPAVSLSCGKKGGRKLNCGNHDCEDICHDGPCESCPVTHIAKCYCGKTERALKCGEGEEKTSMIRDQFGERKWTGHFACENVCKRSFDCGIHTCSASCHPQDPSPSPCPQSPSNLTHCPCGKHELAPSSSQFFPPGSKLPRAACTDPIPTCESTCVKPLEGCEHVCSAKCHTGPCPPCSIILVRPCRCGSTTRNIQCSEEQARVRTRENGEPGSEILCQRACTALRNCGRHQCNRICCPLASLTSLAKLKAKKAAGAGLLVEASLVDEQGWHECDLVCDKSLSCGNHRCEERDHKGACPPCLRSSFEEVFCHCGRTVLEPPIPCGTRINCTYPCDRPDPPCGHPKSQHTCHEDPTPCPPCVILTGKKCACGKKIVGNVKCSQEKVFCGQTCGRLLGCGFHHCERLCHGGDCGPCTAPCGKPRKLCLPALHPCTLPCHAPAACSETEPCRTVVEIACACGRIRHPVSCGRSISHPGGREGSQQLQCNNECLVAKRNARLAEALGITPETRAEGRLQQATYNEDLMVFARNNMKFCTMVEKSMAEFLSSAKRSQVLAPMPEARRKFVHDLATVYRIDTQMVDQEPYRSVQLIRRIDSRVPSPLLSNALTSAPVPSPSASASTRLTKLTDLRATTTITSVQQPNRSTTPAWSRASTPPTASHGAGANTSADSSRGWSAVVTQRPPPKPDTDPTAWLTDRSAGVARPSSTTPHAAPGLASRARGPSPAPAVDLTSQVAEDVPEDWEDAA